MKSKRKTATVLAQTSAPALEPRMTEQYARMVARDAYFWAWPMINVYNRRLAFKDVPEPGLMGGIVPVAPLNRLSMLTNYIEPQERIGLPEPGRSLRRGGHRPRAKSGRDPGAELRQALLGLPDRRSAHRLLRRAWGDVRHQTRLIPARRAGLEGQGTEGHRQGVPREDQHRLRRPARFPGRQAGRQQGGTGGDQRHRHVPARDVRRQDESP
jgi:hypothetical protein